MLVIRTGLYIVFRNQFVKENSYYTLAAKDEYYNYVRFSFNHFDGLWHLPWYEYICYDFRRIGEHLEEQVPNLEMLILTNNNIQDLVDLDNLATNKNLKYLR